MSPALDAPAPRQASARLDALCHRLTGDLHTPGDGSPRTDDPRGALQAGADVRAATA